MRVKLKTIGKGTLEDPIRPDLPISITFNNAKYDDEGNVVIEIAKKDLKKIEQAILGVVR